MAPVLAAFQPTLDGVMADLAVITGQVLLASPADLVAGMQARLDAATALQADLRALRDLAASGVGILRVHPPEACWAEYAATQMSGWLLIGDSTQSLDAGDMTSANVQLGAGVYLLGAYGTLVHGVAVEACA